MMMLEQVKDTDTDLLIAMIVRAEFKREGVEFFTPDNFSQQLGYMNRPKGYTVNPHTHKKVISEMHLTHEVLYIKTGKIKILLYNNNNQFIKECILNTGDVILLAAGGHSIEMLEDSELIEIKQGPYSNDDRVDFTPVIKNDEQ